MVYPNVKVKNHAYLVEAIRKRVGSLESYDWKIRFPWGNAHILIYCKELADRLANEAVRSNGLTAFNRIP
jgi:hypothetical protein